jgi:acyl-coenzyme A synthetase/AMP-(fatty) acid ligase
MPAGIGAAVGMFACLAARRPAILLDAAQAPARNAAILRRAGADQAVAPDGAAPPGVIAVPIEAAFATGTAPRLPDGLGAEELSFILCTSGSTGEPKLIAHSQRGILQQIRVRMDGMRAGEADRYLLIEQLASLSGMSSLLMPLHGCAVDILSLNENGLAALRDRLRSHPPSIMRAGPSLLRVIAQVPDAARMLSSLRVLRVGGEPLLRADLELALRCLPPGCLVYNRYGATEMSGLSWFPRLEDDHDPVRTAAGLPDAEVEMKIVDATGTPCPPGEAGELWLRGRYGSLGEWTAEGLRPGRADPDPEDPGLRVYRTGDLARLTPDGVAVVLGRLDRMVKVNGQRVELAEVEAALRRHGDVNAAAVVAREAAGRVTLHAFVVPAPGAAQGLETQLRQALRSTLPGYMLPHRITLLDVLPLLPGGKLDERALLDRPA